MSYMNEGMKSTMKIQMSIIIQISLKVGSKDGV